MIPSSTCFLVPIFLLPLIPNIRNSLLFLFLMSSIYNDISINNYKLHILFQLLDNIAIINMCSMTYFNNFTYSLYYIILFLLEYRFWKTKMVLYFIYGLNIYSNIFIDSRIEFWLFISICTYLNPYLRQNTTFLWHERWVWHFGQSMYIYHSLKYKRNLFV